MADVAETTSTEVPVEKKEEEVAAAETEKEDAAKNGAEKEAAKAPAAAAAEAEITKEERAIIRQIEYYFGDANLNRDKFLREQISKDEEGWVPLSVLVTFKRLAELSTDYEVIINALVKSDEGLLEISEDKQSLRRHPERPIPEHNEERRKEIQERTVYAKGFPLDTQMAALIEFTQAYEKVVNINMRKYLDKAEKNYKFKGSVFITFETKEQATEFMAKDKLQYKERELLRKWQVDYLKEKHDEIQKKTDKRKQEKQAKNEPVFDLPKNSIVVFEGAPDTTTREDIRAAFEKVGECEIAYIDFSKGLTEGSVRLSEADSAEKFIAKVEEGKLKLTEEANITLRKATEEEEKVFLQKAVDFMKKRRDFSRNKNNKRFGRKRGGPPNDNRPKKARVD